MDINIVATVVAAFIALGLTALAFGLIRAADGRLHGGPRLRPRTEHDHDWNDES